jgi:hypothetical protein
VHALGHDGRLRRHVRDMRPDGVGRCGAGWFQWGVGV